MDIKSFIKHKTKRNTLIRFGLVLAVFISYFVFISFKYGAKEGFSVTILTWSFFVYCTPIADAGFLVDFPVRLITKVRMIFSEMGVWILAALINTYTLIFHPSFYQKSHILKIFHYILSHPFPFWGIILLAAGGTYLSIHFGDELIDVAKHKHREKYHQHKNKHRLIIIGSAAVLMIVLYTYLINQLGLNIPLI